MRDYTTVLRLNCFADGQRSPCITSLLGPGPPATRICPATTHPKRDRYAALDDVLVGGLEATDIMAGGEEGNLGI